MIFYKNIFFYFPRLILIIFPLLLLNCSSYREEGYLRVESLEEGSFDIFKISGDKPILFTSETTGTFNKDIKLNTGSYLLLADCSYDIVVIKPNHKEIKKVHTIKFIPPIESSDSDIFSIQCSRFEKIHFRQTLTNRFNINIFSGNHQFLVGMIPFSVNIESDSETHVQEYKLSALKMEVADNFKDLSDEYRRIATNSSYFISPTLNRLSVTTNQKFGSWAFLLPGVFSIELNGTKKNVDLKESEAKIINPAFLQIQTPSDIDLEQYKLIEGSYPLVEINDSHWLNFNEIYPILPGNINLKLDNATEGISEEVKENTTLTKNVKSIQVNLDCNEWDWACLGSRQVFLYTKDSPIYFAKSSTDIPILYFQDSISIEIERAKGIKYHIVNEKNINLGKLILKPRFEYLPNVITDLVRIEGSNHTRTSDIQSDIEPLTIPLFPGSYSLEKYNLIKSTDERKKSNIRFQISAFQETELEYTVIVSEKHLSSIQKQQQAKSDSKDNLLYNKMKKSFVNSWPLKFH